LKAPSTLITKFRKARGYVTTAGALNGQPLSAFLTEYRLFSILKIAFGAIHFVPSLQFSPGDEYSYSTRLLSIKTYIIPQNMSTDFQNDGSLDTRPNLSYYPTSQTATGLYIFITQCMLEDLGILKGGRHVSKV
jgi:hypothetical protein